MSSQQIWTGERLETFIQNESTIEHLHRYAIAAEMVTGKTVLDIACGEGYGTAMLATKAADVTGMDIDQATIERARAKYKGQPVRFERAAAEKIPSPDHRFDVVVSFETLEHTDAQEEMMLEIKRVLKPDGLLILSTPEKKNYSDKTGYKNPFHKKELYQHELKALLEMHFSHHEIFAQQMVTASLITGTTTGPVKQYTGNFYDTVSETAPAPLYLFAIASDGKLPAIPTSIFNGASVMENALLLREKMVTGTLTYRLGHVLLYPFKKIRQLLKKQ